MTQNQGIILMTFAAIGLSCVMEVLRKHRNQRHWDSLRELSLFPEPEAAKAALSRARSNPISTLARILIFAGFVSLTIVGDRLIGSRASTVQTTICVGLLLLFAVTMLAVPDWLADRRIRLSLRRELNRRGIPVCLRCGYSLQGLTESRCPECGRPFAT